MAGHPEEAAISLVLKAVTFNAVAVAAGMAMLHFMALPEQVASAPAEVAVSIPEVPPPPDGGSVITTRRMGPHHVVEARLSGPGATPVSLALVVDTGASVLVLPASLREQLGFDDVHLSDGLAQTARGTVRMKRGRLARIELGGPEFPAVQHDVDVAFIDDSSLGGMALLGMSFLGRYQVTIDDSRNRITLVERP